MQSALRVRGSWCEGKEEKANPSKTKLILFSKKKYNPGFHPPKFFGKDLTVVDQVKHLGVHL